MEDLVKHPLHPTLHPTVTELVASYRGRRVLVTGHTGFKGSWLTLWLTALGAEVTGLSLAPDKPEAMFERLKLSSECHHELGDLREFSRVKSVIEACRPEFVFHLGAQALVRESVRAPLETITTNIVGTANVLDALRVSGHRCAAVMVTSDKCYAPREDETPHNEDDRMGGVDPYSMSKGAAELVVSSYRQSFFTDGRVRVATARAGNVIGGGDWADERLVPDAVRAISAGLPVVVRNPDAVRPWQHVLEPLGGYLLLGARLAAPDGDRFAQGWNFGPSQSEVVTVSALIEKLIAAWGKGTWVSARDSSAVRETQRLTLAVDKALRLLQWRSRWSLSESLTQTAQWYQFHLDGAAPSALRAFTLEQIERYGTAPGEA